MAYLPIENHGIIGNMRSAALVGTNGTIDWFCFPQFDSPSIFAAILDDEKGGFFSIHPAVDDVAYKQTYWYDTNVLGTRFLTDEGIGEITDYMPLRHDADPPMLGIVRSVRCVRGKTRFRLECRPAFNYARDDHEVTITDHGACFLSEQLNMGLSSEVPLEKGDHGSVVAEFELSEGETITFILQALDDGADTCQPPLAADQSQQLFDDTVDYWRNWLTRCHYTGRWRDMVYRSALTMKLLTFETTGAIVAAPTTSLPEAIGGKRNWDYRYTWIRDAAFTLYGFMRIGFTDEAAAFIDWIQARSHEREEDGSLQIMYSIDGKHELDEEILDHLEGYRGSGPVRIGNAAYDQFQLDIYGELMDAVYLYNKYGEPIPYDLWVELRDQMDWLCDHWDEKDKGIWESRGEPMHYVYSKLMCWVALDRAIRLADKRSLPTDRQRWLDVRNRIYEQIMEDGWDDDKGAFIQAYGNDALDAANLIMPLVFFVSPTDPRMLQTLDAVNRPPKDGGLVSDCLVYRYDYEQELDGIGGVEGTFNMCTFWLVEALTRAGRLNEARTTFERMLGYANHLGLYAEETGPRGEALGNFPQAFTHLALISAAFNLDRALNKPGATIKTSRK